MGEPAEITDMYTLDIHRFGRTSAELARWIDRSEGSDDLGCLFRAMAIEARDQINRLEDSSEAAPTRDDLRRLAGMFADAELIALAAERRSQHVRRVSISLQTSCGAHASTRIGTLR